MTYLFASNSFNDCISFVQSDFPLLEILVRRAWIAFPPKSVFSIWFHNCEHFDPPPPPPFKRGFNSCFDHDSYLSSNNLVTLPTEIGGMTSLTYLYGLPPPHSGSPSQTLMNICFNVGIFREIRLFPFHTNLASCHCSQICKLQANLVLVDLINLFFFSFLFSFLSSLSSSSFFQGGHR